MDKMISFMGVDFRDVKEKRLKMQNVDQMCIKKLDRIKDVFYSNDFVYFCMIMDGLEEEFESVSYSTYCAYCCALDAHLFTIMNSDADEIKDIVMFQDYIGFHPGSLFGLTVDNNNIYLYDFLCELRKEYWLEGKKHGN